MNALMLAVVLRSRRIAGMIAIPGRSAE